MILQSTEQLLRAIAALKTRPEGQVFFEWLAQSGDATLKALPDIADERQLRQEQGAAQLLQHVNTIVSNVESLLKPSR